LQSFAATVGGDSTCGIRIAKPANGGESTTGLSQRKRFLRAMKIFFGGGARDVNDFQRPNIIAGKRANYFLRLY